MLPEPEILIVDDDPPVAASLRRLFRRSGFKVEVALGGKEAIRLLDSLSPDVVMSDYLMPDISGVEVLSAVRQRIPGAVRVLISGYADSEAQLASWLDDAQCFYVAKPWDDGSLVAEVKRRLEHTGDKGRP